MLADDELLHEGEIGLRYSRQERLKEAPASVQQMYDAEFIVKPGLIGSLTATKGSRSILFALILVLIFMLVALAVPSDHKSGKINSVPVKMQSLIQNSDLYVSVIFGAVKEIESESLPVSIYCVVFNPQNKILESKMVETMYLGGKCAIPLKFSVVNAARLDIEVILNGKSLHLYENL